LWFGVVLGLASRRVERIVSRPHRLRSIVVRGGEERLLLVVWLKILSIGAGHPAVVRLHVMELRAWTMPLELVLWTCWRRVGGACCNGNVLSTSVVSQYAPRVLWDCWPHLAIICWSIEPCLLSPEDSSRRIFERSSSIEHPNRSLARSIDDVWSVPVRMALTRSLSSSDFKFASWSFCLRSAVLVKPSPVSHEHSKLRSLQNRQTGR
jgi:hypothetical protein